MSDDSTSVPAEFESDSIAVRVDWEPHRPKDGANYRTRIANRVSDQRINLEPSGMSKIIVIFVLVFGIISLVIGSSVTYLWLSGGFDKSGVEGDPGILKFVGPGFLLGAVVSLGGAIFLRKLLLAPIVIDREIGKYWKGSDPTKDAKAFELQQVYAIQILRKLVTQSGPDGGAYPSYEVNFVTKDADRFTAFDHGDLEPLREDAELLAEFLSVPLWDASK